MTYDQVVSWKPCWMDSEQGVKRLKYYNRKLGGKATALDILKLKQIPAEDRLWVVLRENMIPKMLLHEFACWCAEQALALIDDPDPRSIAAIEAKRRWMRGEITDNELAAARAAAKSAARAAAKSAAWYAAWDDARTAARAAAKSAAWAAAWYDARAAAWDDAWDDARAAQVKRLIEMLEEYKCAEK